MTTSNSNSVKSNFGWVFVCLLLQFCVPAIMRAATVTLNATDPLGTSSFNSAGNWSSGASPTSGNAYSVGAGLTLRTPNTSGNFTFGGDSLIVSGSSAVLLYKGIGNNTITVNDLQLGNGGAFTNGTANTTATLAGAVTLLTGGGIFDATGDATGNQRQLFISANVTGSGNLSIRSTGSPGGIVTLLGTNNYTGTTAVSGTSTRLQLAKQVALYNNNSVSWTATNIAVNSTCVLSFNVGGAGEFTSSDLDILLSLGTSSGGFKNGSFVALDTTNASGGNFTYNTAIANTNGGTNVIGLQKIGSNALTLNGVNTYTGGTTVSAGTLIVGDATHASASIGAVTVSGTLRGIGTVGAVTVQSGGKLAAGNEGTLGILRASSLIQNTGSTYSLTLQGDVAGTGYNQTLVSDSMTLNGIVTLELTLTTTYTDGSVLTIIDNQGSGLIGGTGLFSYSGMTLSDGDTFTVTNGSYTQAFTIDYGRTTLSQNDIILTATTVPEPGTLMLFVVGVPLMVALRRRSRK